MTQASVGVNKAASHSLLGRKVEFPTGQCEWLDGVVIREDVEGRIVVEDEDGALWKGWEYQVVLS